jgi:hypothetical protein
MCHDENRTDATHDIRDFAVQPLGRVAACFGWVRARFQDSNTINIDCHRNCSMNQFVANFEL